MKKIVLSVSLLFGVMLFSGCLDSNVFLANGDALQSVSHGKPPRVEIAVKFDENSGQYGISEMDAKDDGYLYKMTPTDPFVYYFVVNGQDVLDTRIFEGDLEPVDYFVDDGVGGFNALCVPFNNETKKVEVDFSLTAATALMNLTGVGSFEQITPKVHIYNYESGQFEAVTLAYEDGFYKAKIEHLGKVMEYYLSLNDRVVSDMRFFGDYISPAPQYYASGEGNDYTALYID